jgi:hypothetical protein
MAPSWYLRLLERVAGIEPATQPWEGRILPLNYTRLLSASIELQTTAAMRVRHSRNTMRHSRPINPGADERARTADLCFTKALLYQLSYIGAKRASEPG